MFKTAALDNVANEYVDENPSTSTPGTRLEANDRNIIQKEIVAFVESSGQTLKAAGVFTTQADIAASIYSMGADFYIDSGSADDYELDRITPGSGFALPVAYFDGMRVRFIAGTANTGASLIEIGSLGTKDLVDSNGTALTAGAITIGDRIEAIYKSSSGKFEIPSIGIEIAFQRGFIDGLILSNDSGDTDHNISVNIGECIDSANAANMVLPSAMIKDIEVSWAVGTGNGGLFSGIVAINTWYAVHLIKKDSDGSIDIGFDISATAANIPAGYTAYRRVGWVLTDGAANILNFIDTEIASGQIVREWLTRIIETSSTGGGTVRQTLIVSCPINEIAKLLIQHSRLGGASVWVASVGFTDIATAIGIADVYVDASGSNGNVIKDIVVDSSSTIAYRFAALPTAFHITSLGYTDRRIS